MTIPDVVGHDGRFDAPAICSTTAVVAQTDVLPATGCWHRRAEDKMTTQYESFFIASTGASAAILGLLIVAVSVVNRDDADITTRERRTVLAGSAFITLADIFIVSIVALTGGSIVVGLSSLAMATVGLLASTRLTLRAKRAGNFSRKSPTRKLNLAFATISAGGYSVQLGLAVALLANTQSAQLLRAVVLVIVALYCGCARSDMGDHRNNPSGILRPTGRGRRDRCGAWSGGCTRPGIARRRTTRVGRLRAAYGHVWIVGVAGLAVPGIGGGAGFAPAPLRRGAIGSSSCVGSPSEQSVAEHPTQQDMAMAVHHPPPALRPGIPPTLPACTAIEPVSSARG